MKKAYISIVTLLISRDAYACGFCIDQSLRISCPLLSEIVPGILRLFLLWFLSTFFISLIFRNKISKDSVHCPDKRTLLIYIVLFTFLLLCSISFFMGSGLIPFFSLSLVWTIYLFIKAINYFIKKPTDITEKIFVSLHFCMIIFILSLIPLKFNYAYSIDRMIKMLNYHGISAYCDSLLPSIIEKGEAAVGPLVRTLSENYAKIDRDEDIINNSAFCLSKIKGESFVEEMGIKYENPCRKFESHH